MHGTRPKDQGDGDGRRGYIYNLIFKLSESITTQILNTTSTLRRGAQLYSYYINIVPRTIHDDAVILKVINS